MLEGSLFLIYFPRRWGSSLLALTSFVLNPLLPIPPRPLPHHLHPVPYNTTATAITLEFLAASQPPPRLSSNVFPLSLPTVCRHTPPPNAQPSNNSPPSSAAFVYLRLVPALSCLTACSASQLCSGHFSLGIWVSLLIVFRSLESRER